MPIPILGEIERLITERGSAAVLQERLKLAGDQYAALEKKNTELQRENQKLQDCVEQLQKENAKLKKTVNSATGQNADFNEDTLRVLRALFERDDLSVDDMAAITGVRPPMVSYHLDLLIESRLVMQTCAEASYTPALYSISPAGRKYIVKNNLAG